MLQTLGFPCFSLETKPALQKADVFLSERNLLRSWVLELLHCRWDFDGFPSWHQVAFRILLTCHSFYSARDIILGFLYFNPGHVSAQCCSEGKWMLFMKALSSPLSHVFAEMVLRTFASSKKPVFRK